MHTFIFWSDSSPFLNTTLHNCNERRVLLHRRYNFVLTEKLSQSFKNLIEVLFDWLPPGECMCTKNRTSIFHLVSTASHRPTTLNCVSKQIWWPIELGRVCWPWIESLCWKQNEKAESVWISTVAAPFWLVLKWFVFSDVPLSTGQKFWMQNLNFVARILFLPFLQDFFIAPVHYVSPRFTLIFQFYNYNLCFWRQITSL